MLIPTDIPGANSRIANLKQATADYVAEYNVCKCRPCHNGGTLALLDGKCICMCSNLFEGLGCQNFKGDKARVPGKYWEPVEGDTGVIYVPTFDLLGSELHDLSCSAAARPAVTQEGNWSCWSSWSDCQGQKRSRTRYCNTEGVPGAECRGEIKSEEYC